MKMSTGMLALAKAKAIEKGIRDTPATGSHKYSHVVGYYLTQKELAILYRTEGFNLRNGVMERHIANWLLMERVYEINTNIFFKVNEDDGRSYNRLVDCAESDNGQNLYIAEGSQ